MVWYKALRRAALAWRDERGLTDDAPTPFDGFKVHWLRRTAATWMRQAGLPPELAAARLGHHDGGVLLLKLYRQLDEEQELREAIDGLGDSLQEAVSARRRPRPGADPTADVGAAPAPAATTRPAPEPDAHIPERVGSRRRIAGEAV
jgi:hypothetical protein